MSFYAYFDRGDQSYQERFGLDFEDFSPGQIFRHRPGVTLSQQDNIDEALDTMNAAMVHYDARYAAATAWGKELMVSTVTLQRLVGMSSKTFARKQKITGFDEIAMTGPVFGGDTLYAESEIVATTAVEDPDVGAVTVLCRGINQSDEEIARVTYVVRVWRRDRHPDDRDGGLGTPAEQPRFLAHRQEADGTLTEQVGLFFEACESGDTFVHWPRRTLLRDEAMEHAWRSFELSPQYHDLDWIEQHAGGQFRFTETWIIGIVTAMTTRTFGRVVANLGWTDIALTTDCAPGDVLQAESTILDRRESKSRPNEGIIHVETRAANQRGEQVVSYHRRLLVYKRDADTPYAAAGY